MTPFLQNLRAFFGRLTMGQKLALGAVVIGSIALLASLVRWQAQPDYALLFAGLAPSDASGIVESLKTQGIKYELRENGSAIYVERGQVYELRLQFAGEGLVSDGPVGYELFDGGTLGMTDFMQKLNLKRALEGELARTITAIKQVEMARVHLVIPERSPFRETQASPTASVVLQLSSGARISPQQIEGIAGLVAGSVEGLDAGGVTVLDTRGNMLSNPDAGDPNALASSSQLRIQRAMEEHLTEKGQSMLDQVLGPGNSIVRVTATLDFTRSVSERDVIDPESATVIAEEQLEEQGGAAGAANQRVRNYELSRTREREEKTAADVEYLTISVILNYSKPTGTAPPDADAAADAPAEPLPYPADAVAEYAALVKNAVGFNEARGDQIAIHQTRFDTSIDDRIAEEMLEQRQQEQLEIWLRYGLMIAAIALAVWLIRSATSRVMTSNDPLLSQGRELLGLPASASGDGALGNRPELAQLAEREGEELVLVDDVYTSKLTPEARKRLKAKHLMFEEIKQQVLASPNETADLIRTWLIEDLRH